MTREEDKLSIWLVDDDENDHLFVQRSLRHSSTDVSLRCFATASDAMTEFQSLRCKLPDLIICDMKMPELSGDAFVHWLRTTKHSAIPLVMRSTSDLEDDVLAAYTNGANAFVKKGMNLEEIDYNINHIIEFGMMMKTRSNRRAAPHG